MTGNAKVWRAPLAGLASVAMIATMGVTAFSASAAAAEVTLNTGAGSFADGKTSKTITDSNDSTAKIENLNNELPTREGYTFTGWYEDGSKTAVSPNDETLAGKTLTAHWTTNVNGGKVTFKPAGASLDKVSVVNLDGSKTPSAAVNEIVVPVASGDVLAEWQVPADSNPLDANQYEWYTAANGGSKTDVKNLKGGDTAYLQLTQLTNSAKVKYDTTSLLKDSFADTKTEYRAASGTKVAAPEGYYYGNGNDGGFLPTWTGKYANGAAYDSNKGIENGKGDLTFTATASTTFAHVVTFVNYDGKKTTTSDKTLLVKDGTTVNSSKRFSEPKSTGDNTFGGFYTSNEFKKNQKANLDASVKTDVTLYAKWDAVAKDVTVSFDPYYDNAPAAETQTVKANGWLAQPKTPTRAGYVFKGWEYTKANGTKAVVSKDAFDDFFPVKVTELKVTDNKASFFAVWQRTERSAYYDAKNAVLINSGDAEVDEANKANYTRQSLVEYTDAYNAATDGEGDGDFDYNQAAKDLKAAQKKLVQKASDKVYVLYNKNNSDHLYTTVQSEYAMLANLGWRAEGVSFKATLKKAPYATAIYRIYNPVSGEHLFAQKAEADAAVAAGWTYDAPAYKDSVQLPTGWKQGNPVPFFYAPQNATTTLNRLFNPNARDAGSHYYTASKGEASSLVKLGWKLEKASALKVAAK